MWSAIGQLGLTLALGLLSGVLAWRWRGRRAWRREQELKRQWVDTLEKAEAFMSRRLEQARQDHAAEMDALRAELGAPSAGATPAPATAAEPRPRAAAKKPRRPPRARGRSAKGSHGSGSSRSSNGASGPLGTEDSNRAAASDPATGGGRTDDLQQIRGVGRVFEQKLRQLGFTTFHDIAKWGSAEIEQVTRRLHASPARIAREGWIRQARELHRRTHGGNGA